MKSLNLPPNAGNFFLVSDPQPDDPDAIEASSLPVPDCRCGATAVLAFTVIKLEGAVEGVWFALPAT